MSLAKEFTSFIVDNEIPLSDRAAALIGKLGVADEELEWLSCLNAAGVDNWEGCDYAADLLRERIGECEAE